MIPVTSTRYSIDALKLPTVAPWRAWYDDGQVFSLLNFVVFHEVPQIQSVYSSAIAYFLI